MESVDRPPGLNSQKRAAPSGGASTENAADKESPSDGGFKNPLPSINLPKGGGAIRSMGEKFSVNTMNGTAAIEVPIATSAPRSSFGPSLSLSYDSGSGNGPFGFGWQLAVPSITRKTDKGLPLYRDEEESDVFIFAGSEDLVPYLDYEDGKWFRPTPDLVEYEGATFEVRRYRPRIEGSFSRIERWTKTSSKEIHWRTVTGTNVTTIFGDTDNSRIMDPVAGEAGMSKIFRWLLSKSWDDRGNWFVYEYKSENSAGLDNTAANENNRTGLSRSSQRYLKRIKYGNRTSHLVDPQRKNPDWMFEVVLDYGEHAEDCPTPQEYRDWDARPDPFSTYRSGFEVRTYRLCERILMFHHFPNEQNVGRDCLVSAFELSYDQDKSSYNEGSRIGSFVSKFTQRAYQKKSDGYIHKALPPVEFRYSQPSISTDLHDLDEKDIAELPFGFDDAVSRWIDLDGEGIQGILTKQGGCYYYKPNLGNGNFEAEHLIDIGPPPAETQRSKESWMDLAGDGHLSLVRMGEIPGFYKRDTNRESGWAPFQAFEQVPVSLLSSTAIQYLDLTGDGLTDVLIANDEVFTWYPSLGETGYGEGRYARTPVSDESGARLLLSDVSEALYVADMSGDGLADLVRVRNGEICYWPNMGYGQFGKKVTMDNAPWFDNPDVFQQNRLRLFDIDGSGTMDLIYLGSVGATYYQNECGNRWTSPRLISAVPRLDNASQVQVVDLFGKGTGVLIWSSSSPGDFGRHIRYVDLMGDQKPHLLVWQSNNLGLESYIQYATSTKFYLEDKSSGRPWLTKLAFPVQVVEKRETLDFVSKNRFVSRYIYHDGFYDGFEREFRGFGMVEQLDTEKYAAFSQTTNFPEATNSAFHSHVPPVLSKSWFHVGAFEESGSLSRHYAHQYYREEGLTETEFQSMLLPDTVMPTALRLNGKDITYAFTAFEAREACRALKGKPLRTEIYALDGSEAEGRPYQVTESNFAILPYQPIGPNKNGVFFIHPRENLEFHYERALIHSSERKRQIADPRTVHSMTILTDDFGNPLLTASITYGRRFEDMSAHLREADRIKQSRVHITFSEAKYTNMIWDRHSFRLPVPWEHRSFELLDAHASRHRDPFMVLSLEEVYHTLKQASDNCHDLPYEAVRLPYPSDASFTAPRWHDSFSEAFRQSSSGPLDVSGLSAYRRLLKHARSSFRSDDLSHELPFGVLPTLAIPYNSYTRAITRGQARKIYIDSGKVHDEAQLESMMQQNGFMHLDGDRDWWHSSGLVYHSPKTMQETSEELDYATRHFFHPLRFRDPFYSKENDTEVEIQYDAYDLLVQESRDAMYNRTTAGIRNVDPLLPLEKSGLDYRLLKSVLAMDPNRNCVALAHNVLGYVAGSAVLGKPEDSDGDSLEHFEPNITDADIARHFESPLASGEHLLGGATTRYVYDIFAFQRNVDSETGDGPATRMSTVARNTHVSALEPGQKSTLMYNISYFDGFSRTIQSKSHAGPGLLMVDVDRHQNIDVNQPDGDGRRSEEQYSEHRWICNGWTIFNNKGDAVQKYEPYYSAASSYEFGIKIGVTATMFYDPLRRVVATLFPDATWSKSIFNSWTSIKWDANDTVLLDPRNDEDVGDYFRRYFAAHETHSLAYQTWYDQRVGGQLGKHEREAALKAGVHAETPTLSFADSLGRVFLTIEHNRRRGATTSRGASLAESRHTRRDMAPKDEDEFLRDTTIFDVEGNKLAIIDAQDRKMCTFEWDMSGTKIYQSSMEAGELWMLHDVSGNLAYGWDSRGQRFRTVFDQLRRSIESHLSHDDDYTESLIERTVYGETEDNAESRNLRTRAYLVYDQAGLVSTEKYDFKGNVLRTKRQFAENYKSTLDWSNEVLLEPHPMAQTMSYDAVNRKVSETAADGSKLHYLRNEVGLLRRIDVQMPGADAGFPYLKDVELNARGQRVWVEYGNKTVTTHCYDEANFHLKRIITYRDISQSPRKRHPRTDRDCSLVQDLKYTFDPIGNTTHIEDGAQHSIFFRNKRIDPSGDYTYDALYRLIEAAGREHLGQNNSSNPPAEASESQAQAPASGNHAHDDSAMSRYVEQYIYDVTGNVLQVHHRSVDEKRSSWTKRFAYDETSLIESEKMSNRLTSISVGSTMQVFRYEGPEGQIGNMTAAPGLSSLQWDHKNQLASSSRQRSDGDIAQEVTYYRYDAKGQRVRKVTEKSRVSTDEKSSLCSVKSKERIYFGPFETFRRYKGDGIEVKLERETLHVSDDDKSFALVETRTVGEEKNVPRQVARYQLSNAIQSVQIELGGNGELLSYEEYSPYGDTTYSSFNGALGAPKRYRYDGKEKDEESGLYYYGARYYLPAAMRWLTPDPGGWGDGPNLYQFVKCNPISKTDLAGTEASWWNRAVGAATAVGGALEIAAGVAGLAAPTGVTQVLGAVAVVHGADTAWAGLKQAFTGEEQKTYTQQGATAVAEAAGASKETAEKIGVGVDMAVGILPDAAGAIAKHGGALLGKLGGAAKAAKSGGIGLAEKGAAHAIEAGHELIKTGQKVLAKGREAVDDAARVVKAAFEPKLAFAGLPNDFVGLLDEGSRGLGSTGGKAQAFLARARTAGEAALNKAAKRLEAIRESYVGGWDRHHMLPQDKEFREFFRQAGLNVHEHILELPRSVHKIIHENVPKGFGKFEREFNEAWQAFKDTVGPNATAEQILKHRDLLLEEFHLAQYLERQGGAYKRFYTWIKDSKTVEELIKAENGVNYYIEKAILAARAKR